MNIMIKQLLFGLLALLLCVNLNAQDAPAGKEDQARLLQLLEKLSPTQQKELLAVAIRRADVDPLKQMKKIVKKISAPDLDFVLTFAEQAQNFDPNEGKDSGIAPEMINEPGEPITSIEFEEKIHDFGKINQGDKVSHTFKFTNTGNEALIIKNVKTTCGCTVASYPKEAISPGDTGKIDVVFDSKGKLNQQYKRIMVIANIPEESVNLTVKALIK